MPTDGLRTTFWQGQEVTYEVVDGYAVHDGDIILGRADEIESGLPRSSHGGLRGPGRRRDTYPTVEEYLWPGGVIPYVIEKGTPERDREQLLEVMAEFNARTAVTFAPYSGELAYAEIKRACFEDSSRNRQTQSHIGRVYAVAETWTIGCDASTIAHELGHLVGLGHEHQRYDRGEWAMFGENYWGWHQVVPSPFPITDPERFGPYDYRSQISYGTGTDSIPPGMPTDPFYGRSGYLSAGDVAGINRIYGHPSEPTVVTTNPDGLEVVVDGHRVSTPAVFHWVAGSTHVLEAPIWQERLSFNGDHHEFGRHLFGRWNNGGSRVHTFTVRPEKTWIEASFISLRRDDEGYRYPTTVGKTTSAWVVADLFEGLNASPRALTFIWDHDSRAIGAKPQLIRLTNRGDSSQRYSITTDRPWLTVEPAGVNLAPGAHADIEVRVLRGGLQPEMHSANLTVRPPGLDSAAAAQLRSIPVAFVVLPELTPVRLGKRGGTLEMAYSPTEGFLGSDGQPVGGDGRVVSVAGDTFVLARSLGGIGATFEPQSQTLDLPGGGQVTLVQHGEGDWYIGDEPVRNGHRHSVGGHDYVLELVGGQWRPAPYAVRVAAGPELDSAFASMLTSPQRVAVDAAGRVFVTDQSGVFEIGLDGEATLLIGGPRSKVLAHPVGVAVGRAGDIFVADSGKHRVVRIDVAGRITTVAGTGENGYSGDGGPATEAQLSTPSGVALDAVGNVYIADTYNHAVRKIDTSGTITTVAGTGENGYSGDGGPATEAELFAPRGVAVDTVGNVYVADTHNHTVRKIDTSGTITTLGLQRSGWNVWPRGVAVDVAGNVYVADGGWNDVLKIDTTGRVTTLAGSTFVGLPQGPAVDAELRGPSGVAVDAVGNVYIADTENDRVRKVDTEGTITTLVGTGGPERIHPSSLAVDASGNAYMTGSYLPHPHSVLKLELDGNLTKVAGTWSAGFSGDGGPATKAELYSPSGVTVDAAGNLYVYDRLNNRVRRIDATGTITTFAGSGNRSQKQCPKVGDLATDVFVSSQASLDSSGNVYVDTNYGTCIAKIDPAGIVISIYGGDQAYLADRSESQYRGPGIPPNIRGPHDLRAYYRWAVDAVGSLYFVERHVGYGNLVHRIPQKRAPTTVANILGWVDSIAIGGDGQFYVATTLDEGYALPSEYRSRIWRVDTRSGIVEVIAGNGEPWFRSDRRVEAMAVDPHGNLWFAADGRLTVLERLPLPPQVTVKLPGGGEILLQKRAVDGGWQMGDTPVQEGHRYVLNGTEYVLAQVGGQWKAVSLSVPLGVSGESAEIKVLTDGSLLHEPTGRPIADGSVLTGADFDDYRINVGPAGVRSNPVSQQQRVNLPGGRQVRFLRGEDGTWRYDGLRVQSGGSIVVGGRKYGVERTQGRWAIVAPDGYSLRTVAGRAPTAEGFAATKAVLFRPSGIAVDAVGNVFIAEAGNRRIRRVDVAGRIWNFAGTGVRSSAVRGSDQATLESPRDLALDRAGNLFFLDAFFKPLDRSRGDNDIVWPALRRINAHTLAVETVGNFSGSSVAVSSEGKVFVARGPTVIGLNVTSGESGLLIDNVTSRRTPPYRFSAPRDMALNSGTTDLYFVGHEEDTWRMNLATGAFEMVTTAIDAHGVALDRADRIYLAGLQDGEAGVFQVDARSGAVQRHLLFPPPEDVERIALDRAGNLYVTQPRVHRVSRINASTWDVVPFAGAQDVTAGWSGGPAESARLDTPSAIALDQTGNLYYTDANRVWRLDQAGMVTAVAGTGEAGYGGDRGPATRAQLNNPDGLVVDQAGNIFIADTSNHRIRRIDTAGVITTVAGTGEEGREGGGDDSPATRQPLYRPRAMAIDSRGNLVFVESALPDRDGRVRKLDASGTISTLGYIGYARSDLTADGNGNLFIAGNGAISHDSRRAIVSTIDAATGTWKEFYRPNAWIVSVAADAVGSVYVATAQQDRFPSHDPSEAGSSIHKIKPDGTVELITKDAINGISEEEPPISISSMVVDHHGKIWFTDPWARRIRVIEP